MHGTIMHQKLAGSHAGLGAKGQWTIRTGAAVR